MVRKAKKQIKGIAEASMVGAGSAIALGGIGGNIAHHGQAGLTGATAHMGTMGTMVGAGMLIRTANKAFDLKHKKKKKR